MIFFNIRHCLIRFGIFSNYNRKITTAKFETNKRQHYLILTYLTLRVWILGVKSKGWQGVCGRSMVLAVLPVLPKHLSRIDGLKVFFLFQVFSLMELSSY